MFFKSAIFGALMLAASSCVCSAQTAEWVYDCPPPPNALTRNHCSISCTSPDVRGWFGGDRTLIGTGSPKQVTLSTLSGGTIIIKLTETDGGVHTFISTPSAKVMCIMRGMLAR